MFALDLDAGEHIIQVREQAQAVGKTLAGGGGQGLGVRKTSRDGLPFGGVLGLEAPVGVLLDPALDEGAGPQ